MKIGRGGGGYLQLDKIITLLFFKKGVDYPLSPTLKNPGPSVGTFDVTEPDVFSLHR